MLVGSALAPNIALAQDKDPCRANAKRCQLVDASARLQVLDEDISPSLMRDLGNQVWWQRDYSAPSTRYIRFSFENISSGVGAAYVVRVIDSGGRILETYSAAQFSKGDPFTTGLLPAAVTIQLLAASKPTLSFRLKRVAWHQSPSATRPESFVPAWQSVDGLSATDPIRKAAAAVVLLHIGPEEVTCSGALVSNTAVVTNNHCIQFSLAFLKSDGKQTRECGDILVEFDYIRGNERGPTARCLSVAASPELDIAVLQLTPADIPKFDHQSRAPVAMRPSTETAPMAIALLHYPLGLPLASQTNCMLRKTATAELQHDCQTASGSSGSPLFDQDMRWIGTHFWGPFPDDWTVKRIEDFVKENGPVFNHARPAAMVEAFRATEMPQQ
jgi:V8-like Glu-specific endopeptidase